MSHVKMGTMYVNQLMCTCTICCHMGKMSDGPVKVGENDCWAQCHMGTMSRFGVIWAQCHLALPIWHLLLYQQLIHTATQSNDSKQDISKIFLHNDSKGL